MTTDSVIHKETPAPVLCYFFVCYYNIMYCSDPSVQNSITSCYQLYYIREHMYLSTVPNTLVAMHVMAYSTSPDIDDSPYVRVEPLLCVFTGLVLADENGVWHWEESHQSAILKVVQLLMFTLNVTKMT